MAEGACRGEGKRAPRDAGRDRGLEPGANTGPMGSQRLGLRRKRASGHRAGSTSDHPRPATQDRGLQGDLLDAVYGARRDSAASFEAFRRYRDAGTRPGDLEVAFARALPVIREVSLSRDRSHISAAAWAIWRVLQEGRFKEGGPRSYWAYLRRTARGAMAHQRAADDRFRLVDRVSPDVCWDGMRVTGRLPGIREIERKMVVEKIPVLVAEQVVARLPFAGREREASLFFLQSVLEGRDVAARGLSDAFDLPGKRLRELLDYVTVAARMAMRRIRAELRAAAGGDLGWQGALTTTAWLYGEDEARGE